jgi:signal transduction histidine kinase
VREPVELQPLIENTLSFLAEKFQRRGVTVERRFEPVATILGDSEKLQQLLLNLFLNAVDAMPQGGTLGVSLAGRAEGGVEIRVADSGTGIPRDHLPRIFEPFYSTKPAGQGSGLGLVVARGIVRDHAGEIDVTSEPGVGTEFSILLPGAAPRRPQSSSR